MELNSYKDKDWSTHGNVSSEKDIFVGKITRNTTRNYKNDEDSLSPPKRSKRSKQKLKLTSKSTSKSCSSKANTVDASYINKDEKSNGSFSAKVVPTSTDTT